MKNRERPERYLQTEINRPWLPVRCRGEGRGDQMSGKVAEPVTSVNNQSSFCLGLYPWLLFFPLVPVYSTINKLSWIFKLSLDTCFLLVWTEICSYPRSLLCQCGLHWTMLMLPSPGSKETKSPNQLGVSWFWFQTILSQSSYKCFSFEAQRLHYTCFYSFHLPASWKALMPGSGSSSLPQDLPSS